MEKEDCEARTLGALAVGVGFGMLIGAALLTSFYPTFQSKEWAAWVQALGSIGAILVAIFISYWGTKSAVRNQLDREARERSRLELGCKHVLENLFDTLQSAYEHILTEKHEGFVHFWKHYLSDHLSAAMVAVERLPMHELGRRERVALAFAAQTAVRHFLWRMDKGLEEIETEPGFQSLREYVRDSYMPQLARFRELFGSVYA
jgi:hypothetical protein